MRRGGSGGGAERGDGGEALFPHGRRWKSARLRRLAGPGHLTSTREMKNRLTGRPRSPGRVYLQK